MDRPAHDDERCAGPGPACFGCHMRSVSFSPAAMPSRYNAVPPATPNNSYERGIPRDHRGMPYLGASGEAMGQKEWDAKGSDFLRKLGAETARANDLVNTGA